MDWGTINIILWVAFIGYLNVKVYNWAHTLNPYDFSSKR